MKAITRRTNYASLTIRQLKAIVSQLHKYNDGCLLNCQMIERHLGIRKSWSRLTKSELVLMLESIDNLKASCPKTRNWKKAQFSPNLAAQYGDGFLWVVYVGCRDIYEANRKLNLFAQCSEWVVMRSVGKRLNAAYELKIWGIDPEVFDTLIDRASMPIAA